jgi:SAM-dependent methyltransferase
LFGEEPSAAPPQRTARIVESGRVRRKSVAFREFLQGIPCVGRRGELFVFNVCDVVTPMAVTPEDHYRGEAGQRYQQQKRAVPEPAIPWVERLRAEKFQPFVSANDAVVEFGVGLGWNLARLECARRIGTDLEDFLSPALKNSGVEFFGSMAQLTSDFADIVICHHVLEHVENPTEMLREARRILKPGGKLLLHVPFEKERKYRRFDSSEPNFHLFSWNAQTLSNLVISQQFMLVDAALGEFGYDRFAAKLAIRMHLGENGFRLLRRLAHLLRHGREVRVVARKAISAKA